MIVKKLEIINVLGLHARAAAKLVKTASRFESRIEIKKDNKTANAKSIMGIMMLAATQYSWIEIIIEGLDELAALFAIEELVTSRFGEEK